MNDLSLHLLDILQNSISAKATKITIAVREEVLNNKLFLSVEDNGCGMQPEQVAKLADPYFTSRTTRKVGMGVPLLKQSAEQSGGEVEIRSTVGEGTFIQASFVYDNIDRPPLGNFANALILTLAMNENIHFVLRYAYNSEEYIFDSEEVKEVLDGMPLNLPSVMKYLEEFVLENVKNVRDL